MNDDNLDLLDLDEDTSMDVLPDAAPFAAPRPKKPWLLLGVGLVIIVLATYVIIRTIGGDSSSSIDIDLDAPTVVVDGAVPVDVVPVPEKPTAPVQDLPQPKPQPVADVTPPAPTPAPVAQQPVAGIPQREITDRKDVSFNPDKADTVPAKKPVAKKPVNKPSPKPQVAPKGSWYVQFGSYSTRALAENAQRQIRAAHPNLFEGKQFVILAAQLANGKTTYRLRIAFKNANDANGFCRNAKSDGLDCYVAK